MKTKAKVEILFPDEKSALAAVNSIKHEENVKKRSNAKATADGCSVVIAIEASDVVAFRAALNAYMRDLQVFESVENNIVRGAQE